MNSDVEYINFLMQSFMAATDTFDIEVNSSEFLKKFRDWLIKRQIIMNDYIYLLEKMNLDFKKSSCTEIGKGFLDSVVAKRFSTSIASPYSNNITRNVNFFIRDGIPYYVTMYGENKICYVRASSKDKIFMTQNPYTKDELQDWPQLHNTGLYDIIVGVYGDLKDKDMESKIEQIVSVKNKLTDNEYIEDRLRTNNNYCYVLASKRKKSN